MRSACLQAGAAVEDDHDVFAQISRLLFLAFAQAFAGRHHQHNRDDAPGNAEHGQKCAQLVGPKRAQDVDNEIAQRHSMHLSWTQPAGEGNPQSAYD